MVVVVVLVAGVLLETVCSRARVAIAECTRALVKTKSNYAIGRERDRETEASVCIIYIATILKFIFFVSVGCGDGFVLVRRLFSGILFIHFAALYYHHHLKSHYILGAYYHSPVFPFVNVLWAPENVSKKSTHSHFKWIFSLKKPFG